MYPSIYCIHKLEGHVRKGHFPRYTCACIGTCNLPQAMLTESRDHPQYLTRYFRKSTFTVEHTQCSLHHSRHGDMVSSLRCRSADCCTSLRNTLSIVGVVSHSYEASPYNRNCAVRDMYWHESLRRAFVEQCFCAMGTQSRIPVLRMTVWVNDSSLGIWDGKSTLHSEPLPALSSTPPPATCMQRLKKF